MKILVSAGPTRERIDPARFISNCSSGKMGYALAAAAVKSGHECVLVSGPTCMNPPKGVKLIRVESAEEMFCEIRSESSDAQIVIMAAAVADYRPKKASSSKIKKTSSRILLELVRNPDILSWLGKNKKNGQMIVGFAAESESLLDNASKKLRKKNADWIIANEIGREGRGFDSDTNEVTMLSSEGGKIRIPLGKKTDIAVKILKILLAPRLGTGNT